MGNFAILQWSYTPPDFMEGIAQIPHESFDIRVKPGLISAKLPAERDENTTELKESLRRAIKARFDAHRVLHHKDYTLSPEPAVITTNTDGSVHIEEPARRASDKPRFTTRLVHEEHRDGERNLIHDGIAAAQQAEQELTHRIWTHSGDRLLASLLQSFGSATSDPNNELVHLYEIRDALRAHFGGKEKATSSLGLEQKSWDRLGKLCNDLPLRQGRHRGKHAREDLRDASNAELEEARSIARAMIVRYVKYLDAGGA